MDNFVIYGGKKLNGEISVDSAKNSILPILAGALLCDGVVVLNNITFYEDVLNIIEILKTLGVKVTKGYSTLVLNCTNVNKYIIPIELSSKLRASIFCLGPLTARMKKARVSYPGGCAIGTRPIDIHLDGLKALNVKITDIHGYITTDGLNMKAGNCYLSFPSVGATENLIMASVLTKGQTKIYGCAKEPEIIDLCNFLNSMGAKIFGAGTDVITIKGVKKLHSTEYTPIPDRIIAGTYMMLPLITGGKVEVKNARADHLISLIQILKKNSCIVDVYNDIIVVESNKRLKGLGKVDTLPYPFFPTDLQQQLTALATVCDGTSIITENLFECRFKQVPELIKMGAKIIVKNKTATIDGVKNLYGAEVIASDLRGGASLVLAGLCANGYTTIKNVNIIDRGYFKLEEKLLGLGANIKRIKE